MAEHTKKIHFIKSSTEETAQLYTSRDDVTPIDGNGQLVSDYPALRVQDGNSTVYAGLVDPLDSFASDLHCTHNNTEYAMAEINMASFSPVLNENSIEKIQYAAQHDLAGLLWDIGDYFETTINGTFDGKNYSNFVMRCVLIGINHNANVEGDHRLHFQMGQAANGLNIGFDNGAMNTSATNVGGWNGSHMKSTVLPSIKALLPADLQSAIKSVAKTTDNTGGGTHSAAYVTATAESGLWLLSDFEVFGSRSGSNLSEMYSQVQYAYYRNGNSKKHYRASNLSTSYWWLRSPNVSNAEYFCYVTHLGTADSAAANLAGLVTPGFCL